MKISEKVDYKFSEPCCFCQHNAGEDSDDPCNKCVHCALSKSKESHFVFIEPIKYWISKEVGLHGHLCPLLNY